MTDTSIVFDHVHLISEDHVYGRKPKVRKAPDSPHTGDSEQGDGKRIGDLIFNVLRRSSRPIGEDDLLIFPYVWNGVHGHRLSRQEGEFPIEGCNHQSIGDQPDNEYGYEKLLFQKESCYLREEGVPAYSAFYIFSLSVPGHGCPPYCVPWSFPWSADSLLDEFLRLACGRSHRNFASIHASDVLERFFSVSPRPWNARRVL